MALKSDYNTTNDVNNVSCKNKKTPAKLMIGVFISDTPKGEPKKDSQIFYFVPLFLEHLALTYPI